jgi:hypothetical protein
MINLCMIFLVPSLKDFLHILSSVTRVLMNAGNSQSGVFLDIYFEFIGICIWVNWLHFPGHRAGAIVGHFYWSLDLDPNTVTVTVSLWQCQFISIIICVLVWYSNFEWWNMITVLICSHIHWSFLILIGDTRGKAIPSCT